MAALLRPRRVLSAVTALAALALSRGRPVSVDGLVDLLWGDAPPPGVSGTLQAYVAGLRKALEPDRPARAPAQVLVTLGPGYALRLPEERVLLTGERNETYGVELLAMADALRRGGLLVFFTATHARTVFLPSPAELERSVVALRRVVTDDVGIAYAFSP